MDKGIFGDFESRKYLELQSQRGESNPGPPDYESKGQPNKINNLRRRFRGQEGGRGWI